jgi:hypothetical protein
MKAIYSLFVVVFLLISCKDESVKQETKPTNDTKIIAEVSGKNAFTTDNLELQLFKANANEGAVIKGKNGTRLDIPKNAFTDSEGKPATGEITIELKEALSMSDIVLGRLTTTSDGKMLSTGGMVYVNARQGDSKLSLAKSKEITITVPTKDYKPEMLVFTGEKDENGSVNWTDPVDIIEKKKNVATERVTDVLLSEFYSEEPVAPVKPVKNTGGFVLNVNLSNPELLPEFVPFKDVKWKLIDEASYSNEDSKKVWSYVGVQRTEKEGVYLLTFRGVEGDIYKTRKYDVIPVFEGKDYEKALASYNEKFAAFEKEKKERIEWEKAEQAREKARQEKYEKINDAKNFTSSYIFNVKKLGWVNCDYFYKDKTATEVIVQAEVNNAEKKDVDAYLVLKKQRVCIPGYIDDSGAFEFSNGAATIRMPLGITATIIAVTADDDGNIKYASKDVTIDKETLVALQLNTTTKEDIKKSLQMSVDQ